MKKNHTLKTFLKKIYLKKKEQDSKEVGMKINDFTQAFHLQMKLPKEKRDESVLKSCLENLNLLKQQGRFKYEFPNFASFYRYVTDPENNFHIDDFKDL